MPLAIAILGGMDTTAGPLLGAIVLRALEELARVWIGGIGYQVVYGAVIIAFVLAMPHGLVGFINKLGRRDTKGDAPLRLREGGVKS
jgi:branched-chain amino acid transport system permease protein